ncbi:DUF305 domain-containing protein [Psychrobacter sp. Ps3]|uniref:DUF305 domain-containing protein n=1 Tax=Psychrobacter sp. Ps3 TaxID=2790957 RepID=UPI001EE09C3A|nr:DUF305 domain-containing protein [Psychrobacter sp. Ps3]MCG3880757.1 DUF305 domain-containing protein [Psychrobacter sp. Ps3]
MNNDMNHKQKMNPYVKFGLMILTSTIVMYIMMYFNTYKWDHVYFSETRAYMALYMGAMMAVIMLAFMGNMYKKTKVNLMIYGLSIVLFAFGLWGVRSQQTVDQVDWMQAMIPHHSIAILTSERADIDDPRVRQLAEDIIKAQKREIGEMQALIEELE